MAMTRIYEVQYEHSKLETYLVEATGRGAAWRHVAGKFVKGVALPTGKRIAELMGQGVKVETAADE